jgi:Cu+-exporting ATPase
MMPGGLVVLNDAAPVATGATAGKATAIDPVCGMRVDPDAPRGGRHTHDGTVYSFCSTGCRDRFAADPTPYLTGQEA